MEQEFSLIEVDVDGVLRGQGADPYKIRQRRPELVEIAAQAIELGRSLAHPVVLSQTLNVTSVGHQTIFLEGRLSLKGSLVFEHLAAAEQVTCFVCTIGGQVEAKVEELFSDSPALSLALDGYANAAAEALAVAACHDLEQAAAARGDQVTVPLSPGMIGWDVLPGQTQLFAALRPDPKIVRLNESGQMIPRKSTSLVVGTGKSVQRTGEGCDYCAMQARCRYRNGGNQVTSKPQAG